VARRRLKERGRRSALAGPIKACRRVYFNTAVFQKASTSFKTSLLHLFHWITSMHGMVAHASMAILTFSALTWFGGKIQRSDDLHESPTTIARSSIRPQYPNASRSCCLHYFSYFHCFLDPSRAVTVDILTIDCSFHCLHFSLCSPKACRTMPFTPTLFDHLSYT
jgi:hypothetical protein